jgi:probable rRNA maturation factor
VLAVSPGKMKALNSKYRNKKRLTDVLSFSRLEGLMPIAGERDIGDVILCMAVARKQARAAGISWKEEVARLTVHGVLHLLGYDDHKAKDRVRMRRKEKQILKRVKG